MHKQFFVNNSLFPLLGLLVSFLLLLLINLLVAVDQPLIVVTIIINAMPWFVCLLF